MTTRSPWDLEAEPPDDWRTRAACRDEDHDMWFMPGLEPQAQAVCHRCPVRAECLAWALGRPSLTRYGVWGGLTEKERDKVLRRRHPIADEATATALRDTRAWLAVQAVREAAS